MAPSGDSAIGRPVIAGFEYSRFNSPDRTSQILTGSARVWFTPAVQVTSAPPSRLSAIEVIGRSHLSPPACVSIGRNVRTSAPVWRFHTMAVPSPPPEARIWPSAENAREVAPLAWPFRL